MPTHSLFNPLIQNFKNYPSWFRSLERIQRLWPICFVIFYWGILFLLQGFRSDHITVGVVILTLNYLGPLFKRIFYFISPLVWTGVVYDSQRFYSDYIRGRIRVEEPYLFDRFFFGIKTATGVLTPNEWCQLHTHWFLDLITGFFYLTFIGIFLLHAAYFVFLKSKSGTLKISSKKLSLESGQMMWAFFWLNVIGYSTYYWYPAAPPWYVAMYGLGPANLSALPNPAGCLRFDQLLGTHFFTGMYGRSADVFGAIPSLHIAYPFLSVLYAFRWGTSRIFAIFFYLIMCFSAVYLNHHYVLDILWGTAYAILTFIAMDYFWKKRINSQSLS